MHITHGTLAQAPDAIAPVPSAHVMLSQAHPPGAVAKTLVAAISTVQCLLPPFCSPVRAFTLPHWAGRLYPAFIEVLEHPASHHKPAEVYGAVLGAAIKQVPSPPVRTLLYMQSTECLPARAQILTVVIETAALIGACVLQLYKPTAHTPVATSAAPPGFMDIAFAPAPCPEILPAGHAARANMAQPRGPGVIITVLVMLVSAAEALLPACCAPVRVLASLYWLAINVILKAFRVSIPLALFFVPAWRQPCL